MSNKVAYYALYRGDEFVDIGTLNELASRYHTSVNTLRFKASPTYAARTRYVDTIRAYKLNETQGGEDSC
ncbi:hypothetical protein LB941_00185 [Ligilactobacillus sp. WILCCON 0076]|uniref:Uncharacterized protein n=1 Tax=Ligilactobacillus ubinensis TaxID=2876789 RepID=A0A9X2JJR9_9LACO|nr:hypothetical protein [Ligilactobacillus ubinensis]MCP0885748.1 hypothetical protein [Ligilactobacillus ubinensis]